MNKVFLMGRLTIRRWIRWDKPHLIKNITCAGFGWMNSCAKN